MRGKGGMDKVGRTKKKERKKKKRKRGGEQNSRRLSLCAHKKVKDKTAEKCLFPPPSDVNARMPAPQGDSSRLSCARPVLSDVLQSRLHGFDADPLSGVGD